MNTQEILAEREGTHGDFSDNALMSQVMKTLLRGEFTPDDINECLTPFRKGYGKLNTVQLEALDMIFHKIARILAGNPNEKDHWNDIAGYATLVSNRIKE